MNPIEQRFRNAATLPKPSSSRLVPALVIGGVLAAATFWSFYPTLGQLAERWSMDPQYSHGFLVPLFALLILWLRRPAEVAWSPDPRGALIVAAMLIPRWAAAAMDIVQIDGLCLIVDLLGLTLLVGGRDVLRWAWPAILFLAFMVPLPNFVEERIAVPLRRVATVVSTYVLQTFGYPAIAEGNVIQIEQIKLGVVEACSGLGMLMTFLALAAAMAVLVPAPKVDRFILLASAIPIAVVANVLRITLTGMILYGLGSREHFDLVHDTLGWLMMPLALGLLWLEWKFLRLLLISTGDVAPLDVQLSPWLERAGSQSRPRWS